MKGIFPGPFWSLLPDSSITAHCKKSVGQEPTASNCGRKQIVDYGKALWQILSEANEEKDGE
jgi:hypothetical protein